MKKIIICLWLLFLSISCSQGLNLNKRIENLSYDKLDKYEQIAFDISNLPFWIEEMPCRDHSRELNMINNYLIVAKKIQSFGIDCYLDAVNLLLDEVEGNAQKEALIMGNIYVLNRIVFNLPDKESMINYKHFSNFDQIINDPKFSGNYDFVRMSWPIQFIDQKIDKISCIGIPPFSSPYLYPIKEILFFKESYSLRPL